MIVKIIFLGIALGLIIAIILGVKRIFSAKSIEIHRLVFELSTRIPELSYDITKDSAVIYYDKLRFLIDFSDETISMEDIDPVIFSIFQEYVIGMTMRRVSGLTSTYKKLEDLFMGFAINNMTEVDLVVFCDILEERIRRAIK